MAVGSGALPELHPVAGVRLGVASAGIKRPGRRDLLVMALEEGSEVAAVFTRNAFRAAPVVVAEEHLRRGSPRWLVVNTGNANAGTGRQGLEDARAVCAALAAQAGAGPEAVLPFSTGVIGEPLPVAKILAALPQALGGLRPDGWAEAASAILTTDTRPKGASRRLTLDGRTVTLTGIAKGAGMIRPQLATMLAFVATDARIPRPLLRRLLARAVERSFNRITVDGDTSTNDAVVLAATGAAGVAVERDEGPFAEALAELMVELAQAIVRDGEGATKFIAVRVEGGRDGGECLRVAYAVAESPLVKTAFFAADPNWGRILAAVGRAGLADLAVERVRIWLDEVLIVEGGGRAATYTEEAGRRVMARDEVVVRIDLGRGAAAETVWTCDLSYDYVRINAEYRT
ncbi:MAG: arginine biosynthesis bifunctional protein ArgJ [Porticoccaceae bacterium]|nr:MAG: arginine biosynthesis bifunctional protein ArgJ [Porticoccaceae bacterium]